MAMGNDHIDWNAPSGLTCKTKEEERRVMCMALAHWEECCPSPTSVPPRASINLMHPILRPHFYIIRIQGPIAGARIEHCGGVLSALCGKYSQGLRLDQCFPRAILADRLDYLDAAARISKPMAESAQFERDNGSLVLFRDAIMPLAPEGDSQFLLGAISYRLEQSL